MICDANVILRYILEDIPDLIERATDIIEKKQVYIPFEVVAEVVYVLEKIYSVKRKELSLTLTNIIHYPNIETVDKQVLVYALNLFSESSLDFVDVLLCGYHYVQNIEIATFDKKLKNKMIRIKLQP